MKKHRIKIRNVLTKLLIYFVSIFSLLSLVFIIISGLIGNSFLGSHFTWTLILIASALLTVYYYFLLKLNKITPALQIVLVYFTFALVTYIICFLLRIFNLHSERNRVFFIIAVCITIFVFVILLLKLTFNQIRETRKLNKYLNKFKERD